MIADSDELKTDRNDPVKAALSRAFNKYKEPRSIRQLADGRIRVVTAWGLIYCVQPADDWGIAGPEDNLPMNMLCE